MASATAPPAFTSGRRSVTAPVRPHTSDRGDAADVEADEIVFEHPSVNAYSFLISMKGASSYAGSKSTQAGPKLPWKSRPEQIIGLDRPLRLRRPKAGAPYLQIGKPPNDNRLLIMPNTEIWIVDDGSKFAWNSRQTTYRVEVNPSEDSGNDRIERFKEALGKVVLLEPKNSICPFQRDQQQDQSPTQEGVESPRRRKVLIGDFQELRRVSEPNGTYPRRTSEASRQLLRRRETDNDMGQEFPEENYADHALSADGYGEFERSAAGSDVVPVQSTSIPLSAKDLDDGRIYEEIESASSPDEPNFDESGLGTDDEPSSLPSPQQNAAPQALRGRHISTGLATVSLDGALASPDNESTESQPLLFPETRTSQDQTQSLVDHIIAKTSVIPGPYPIVESEEPAASEEPTVAGAEEATSDRSAPPEMTTDNSNTDPPSTETRDADFEPDRQPQEEPYQREDLLDSKASEGQQTPPSSPSAHESTSMRPSESSPSLSIRTPLDPTRSHDHLHPTHSHGQRPSLRRASRSPSPNTSNSGRQPAKRAEPGTYILSRLVDLLTSPPSKLLGVLLDALLALVERALGGTGSFGGDVVGTLRLPKTPGRWVDSDENSECDGERVADAASSALEAGDGQDGKEEEEEEEEEEEWESDGETDDYGVPLGNQLREQKSLQRLLTPDGIATGTDLKRETSRDTLQSGLTLRRE